MGSVTNLAVESVKGAAAAAAATWALERVTSFTWEHESPARAANTTK